MRNAVLVERPAAVLPHQGQAIGSRLETPEVFRFAGEFVHRKVRSHLHREACTRRVVGIDFLLARRKVLGAVFRLVVVEHGIGMSLRPLVGALGGILERRRVFGVPALLCNYGTERERLRRRVGRHRVGGAVVTAARRRRRGRYVVLVNNRKHRAVVILHAEQVIHSPLHLVKDIGNPVARFGNVVVVGKCSWHVHVGAQERLYVVAVPDGVLVEVARIEPPTAHVTFRRGIRAIRKQAGGLVLRVVHAIGPVLARILFLFRHAYALVEHHAHRRLQDVVIHVVPDAEVERLLQVIRLVTDKVSTRRIELREVEPPDFIA